MLRHDVDRYEPPPDQLRHVQLVLAGIALDADEPDVALREVLDILGLREV